ncbi:preprotein translocase subunit SecG [Erythrobacter ani]|uniref:Protein-export membrane protein SecG n=1 Tax=Erythrobacter ani TaxID=2827235 RepID=A0ABS6SPP0_9SPHN|nr:preprotein translocase subunit SecG [Erythrobacter ani]MBV7267013.1 preprotein translocase subunit SecG [Erythrobacter ani]
MFLFLTVLQAIVAAALVGVVLMQRSEGGGLGIGGNPNGALGARGAADFLTRATKWLAVAFVALSIALAAVAVNETSNSAISTTLDRDVGGSGVPDLLGEPSGGDAPANEEPVPAQDDPLAE